MKNFFFGAINFFTNPLKKLGNFGATKDKKRKIRFPLSNWARKSVDPTRAR